MITKPQQNKGQSNHVHILLTIPYLIRMYPDSKVHGANMGPNWVLSDPDGLHVGPMNLAIRVSISFPCIFPNRIIHQFQYTIVRPNTPDEHINHARCFVSQLPCLEMILFVTPSEMYVYDQHQSRIWVNSSPPGQNVHYFPDDIFNCIFMNEKFCILIRIYIPNGTRGRWVEKTFSNLDSDSLVAQPPATKKKWENPD